MYIRIQVTIAKKVESINPVLIEEYWDSNELPGSYGKSLKDRLRMIIDIRVWLIQIRDRVLKECERLQDK